MIQSAKIQKSKTAKAVPKAILIDGSSFCYRAYYAIAPLSNSKGEPTNALYGFIAMMKKLLTDTKPAYVAICFDRKEPTFRHDKFKEYKAHRKPMPEDLVQQLVPIKEYCRLARVPLFEEPGYEADDILGTIAHQGEKKGWDVFIVTGDKDMLQLVTDHVKVLNPHKENWIGDREAVKKRFEGLGPEKVVEIMALMGDASDNIPGVPGIGEKTALKLIHQFGSVENLLKYADKVSSKFQQDLIKEHTGLLKISRELASIDTKVPIKINLEDLKVQEPDGDGLMEFYKRYELRNFLKELHVPSTAAEEKNRNYHLILDAKALEAFAAKLEKAGAFSFDTETTSEDPMRAKLVGMSFAWKPYEVYYIPVSSKHHCGQGMAVEKVMDALTPMLENPRQKKYGQNLKYDWMVLKRMGVEIQGYEFDTMIASYLINPIKLNHNLDDISLEYLDLRKITTESLMGSGKNQRSMAEVPLEQIRDYACEDADCVLRLVSLLQEKIQKQELGKVFHEVEMPLAIVLAKMEMNGVCLDTAYLKELSKQAGKDLESLSAHIYKEAGQEFNINSPKQLADILFVKLKLPAVKKTKTGFSTDVSVLEKLALKYELPKQLLEYREKNKLKSTYLDALPEMIHPETGLVHTSYHQTTTVTGRLSSSDPNLQNIPIRAREGRLIRKGFIPRKKGNKILSADYSQIELRILAHLADDDYLKQAFQDNKDVHKFTATQLYGIKEAEVTREMRDVAKTINFSIIYGKSAFGLSQDLGISVSEADGFIQNYFKRYHAVKDYMETQKEQARKEGYLVTLLGRRSYFPDIHSKNVQVRQFAERAAINAPIQGSAADLIKLAMIAIQNALEGRGGFQTRPYKSLMIMQVHDELVFDGPQSEMEDLTKLVKRGMENVYKMKVPLVADVTIGDSWYKN